MRPFLTSLYNITRLLHLILGLTLTQMFLRMSEEKTWFSHLTGIIHLGSCLETRLGKSYEIVYLRYWNGSVYQNVKVYLLFHSFNSILRFRLSPPSGQTYNTCRTDQAIPDQNPENVIGEGDEPGNLVIYWTVSCVYFCNFTSHFLYLR